MSTTLPAPFLRDMEPGDSLAIAELAACSPETGYISVYERFLVDPGSAFRAESEAMDAVVARSPDASQVIGCAMISYGKRTLDGEVVPGALIHDVKVHPAHRGRSVGSALVRWCHARATARLGRAALVLAFIQRGNRGSFNAFARDGIHGGPWFSVGMRKTRRWPPRPRPYEVRPATGAELTRIAAELARFYQAHDLYTPHTDASLASWLARSPLPEPIHEYWVAVDGAGSLLAGIGLTWRSRMTHLCFAPLPLPLRAANKVLRLVPPDRRVRVLVADKIWFRPDAARAGRYLWEYLCWHARNGADVLRANFDPHSPVSEIIGLAPWLPRASIQACANRHPRGQRPICP
ncbi:MAG TPA: GNAT family N-acetyltransferase [Haliangium sp.]|nr:GNAT family N-acetyltransferase [Haliangium sp.]